MEKWREERFALAVEMMFQLSSRKWREIGQSDQQLSSTRSLPFDNPEEPLLEAVRWLQIKEAQDGVADVSADNNAVWFTENLIKSLEIFQLLTGSRSDYQMIIEDIMKPMIKVEIEREAREKQEKENQKSGLDDLTHQASGYWHWQERRQGRRALKRLFEKVFQPRSSMRPASTSMESKMKMVHTAPEPDGGWRSLTLRERRLVAWERSDEARDRLESDMTLLLQEFDLAVRHPFIVLIFVLG
jgi:uncharacterized protein YjiS (DUF1127 family)